MPLLSREEYLTTLHSPMSRVMADESPSIDFWTYFDAIPAKDFEGFDCSAGEVTYAWRDATGRYEHVLVNSTEPNVFMALILDRTNMCVIGHRLLNLNFEYGLRP
jgi:hypothetical protein